MDHTRGLFPPHARGWTVTVVPVSTPSVVSPARAGMDPKTPRLRHRRSRFPRTRGDGPHPRPHSSCRFSFPPHARGWTQYERQPREHPPVSPARAGMDPPRTAASGSAQSFPRTRGDGPSAGVGFSFAIGAFRLGSRNESERAVRPFLAKSGRTALLASGRRTSSSLSPDDGGRPRGANRRCAGRPRFA